MRYPSTHRDDSRRRILREAARAIRERGIAHVGVAEVMQRAGLTHGAFYHHFAGRDALLAEAVPVATAETSALAFGEDADLASMLATYCSTAHAMTPGEGCILAAAGAEAAHHPDPGVRAAFARGARGFIAHVARVLGRRGGRGDSPPPDEVSDAALALASRMLGAVILARLVDDDRLASRILAAARA